VVFEWFGPMVSFGKVYDCAELAHRVGVKPFRMKIMDKLYMALLHGLVGCS
jgi:hypothetical protein